MEGEVVFLLQQHGPLAQPQLVQAEQHAHQRGLSGAVFSQQRVDLAPLQLERDVVVCDNSRKALGDIQHFNGIWLFQAYRPPPLV